MKNISNRYICEKKGGGEISMFPTKEVKKKLPAELAEWERRMRLREFFYAEGTEPQTKQDKNDPSEKFKVPKKSSLTPNKGRDMWLDMYIEMVKTDIIK